jgi:hypothetical protein
MTLVDSLDSVIMTYSYTGLLERKKGFCLIERLPALPILEGRLSPSVPIRDETEEKKNPGKSRIELADLPSQERQNENANINITNPSSEAQAQLMRLRHYTTSNLGITLTLMSIIVAFRQMKSSRHKRYIHL